MTRRPPDFIGIGARRCASSWLHGILSSHPDIGKPENGLHYFSYHNDKDKNWYLDQLMPFAHKPLLVEYSVSYSYPEYCQEAAKRMKKEVPDAELFVCLRNPSERAYSDYLRSVRTGEIHPSITFSEVIRTNLEFVERGRYSKVLLPFVDAFGGEKIKIIFFEDLQADPQAFVEDLASYMSIAENFSVEKIARREPRGKTVRSHLLTKSVHFSKSVVDGLFKRAGLESSWSNWKGHHVYRYEALLDLTHRPVQIAQQNNSELIDLYFDDIEFVEKLTGRNLADWRKMK